MVNKIEPNISRIKIAVKSIDETPRLSQHIIYFFKIIYIWLGLDFGFMKFKSPKIRFIMKARNTIQCIFICVVVSLSDDNNLFTYIWYSFYSINYFFNIMITTLFSSKKTFCDLQDDLLMIDSKIGIECQNSCRIEYKMMVFLSVIILFRILFSCLFFYLYNFTYWFIAICVLLYIPLCLTNDYTNMTYMFTIYTVYCRILNFGKFIKEGGTDIVDCEYIYKSMIDSTEKAMKPFEIMFLIGCLCNTPQVMMSVYFVLAHLQNKDISGISISPFLVDVCTSMAPALIMIFLPVYFAGKLSFQTDKLKLQVHDILLHETDVARSRDLERFIRYMEARPFKFTICHIIPMDWTLPVLVLNIIVTYLIVAIQFTHLY